MVSPGYNKVTNDDHDLHHYIHGVVQDCSNSIANALPGVMTGLH